MKPGDQVIALYDYDEPGDGKLTAGAIYTVVSVGGNYENQTYGVYDDLDLDCPPAYYPSYYFRSCP